MPFSLDFSELHVAAAATRKVLMTCGQTTEPCGSHE